MKKILIVSLAELENLYATSTLAAQALQRFPQSEISLLTKKSFQKCAETLTIVDQFFYLEDEKIESILSHDQISDEIAYELLTHNLAPALHQNWDELYSTSANRISILLSSAFNARSNYTLSISEQNLIKASSGWQLYLKAIEPKWVVNTIPYLNLIQRAAGLPTNEQDNTQKEATLSFSSTLVSSAKENFDLIRQKIMQSSNNIKLVAVVISSECPISELTYAKMLDQLISSPNFYPIVIFNNTEMNKKIINNLNNEFNDSLLSVSSSYHNLGAILQNVDLITSFDIVATRIAELSRKQSVMITTSKASLEKNCVCNETIQILIDPQNTQNVKDLPSDIIQCLKLKSNSFIEKSTTSNSVYISQKDSIGMKNSLLFGSQQPADEFERDIIRFFNYQINEKDLPREAISQIFSTYSEEIVGEYIANQKNAISLAVKHTLNSIRYLEENSAENVVLNSIKSLIKTGSQVPLLTTLSATLKFKIENTSILSDEDYKVSLSEILNENKQNLKKLVFVLSEVFNAIKSKSRKINTTSKLSDLNYE